MEQLTLGGKYTQVTNDLLEKLMTVKITLHEHRVALAVIRRTFGFHREMDRISEGQISSMTGIDRRNVHRAVTSLLHKKILKNAVRGDGKKSRKLGIQMDYRQ